MVSLKKACVIQWAGKTPKETEFFLLALSAEVELWDILFYFCIL